MLQCQSRLYPPVLRAAPFSLCTAITEIQVWRQMFHYYADSTGVHTDGRGPCPDQEWYAAVADTDSRRANNYE